MFIFLVDSTVILRRARRPVISSVSLSRMILIRVRFGLALLKWNWLNDVKWNHNLTWYGRASRSLSIFDSSKIQHVMSIDVNGCMREGCTLYPTILSKLKSGRCDIEWLGRFWPRVTSKHDEHIGQFRTGRQCYGYVKMRCVWFRVIGKKHTTWHLSHLITYQMYLIQDSMHIWWSWLSVWHSNVYPLYNHTTSIHF